MSLVATMLRSGLPVLGLLLNTGLPLEAHAGAWLRSEGEVLISTNLSLSSADHRWDDKRKRFDAGCTTRRQTMDVYAEYGYSYYHTLFADAGLSHKQCAGEPSASGLSDLSVGIRGRLDPFRNGRSWELALMLPISGTTADPRRPGNGEFGLEAGVHFRLAPDPYENQFISYHGGIWSWGAGTKLWSGGLAHQAWSYVGWGRDIDGLWSVSTRLSGTLSFGGKRSSSDGSRSNDYDELTATIDVRRRLSRDVSVSLGLSQDLWGRNTDQELGLRLGVSRQWR